MNQKQVSVAEQMSFKQPVQHIIELLTGFCTVMWGLLEET